MTDGTHDPEEIQELRALPRQATPPREFEDHVVDELRRLGLLRPHGAMFRSRLVQAAMATAASVALFIAGWLGASIREPRPVPEAHPSYVLLLRAGPDYQEGTDIDEQQRVKEYGTWARKLHERGQLISAEKLSDDARSLVARNGAVGVLERRGGDQGAVQGLFLIRAASFDEALEIARGCPHLRHGGVIEVRPIDPT